MRHVRAFATLGRRSIIMLSCQQFVETNWHAGPLPIGLEPLFPSAYPSLYSQGGDRQKAILNVGRHARCQPHDHYCRRTCRSATYTPFWNPTGIASGPGPDPPREPPRQAHQVSVVLHRMGLGVTAPDQPSLPGPESARRIAPRLVGVKHDPVDAVIRAGQQACIPRREVISHPPTVGLRYHSRQPDCPKGPFLPGEVPDGT
jgi:hypothetical protein